MKHFYRWDCLLNAVSIGRFNENRTVLLTHLRYNHYHLQSKEMYICRPITVSGTGAEPFI